MVHEEHYVASGHKKNMKTDLTTDFNHRAHRGHREEP